MGGNSPGGNSQGENSPGGNSPDGVKNMGHDTESSTTK